MAEKLNTIKQIMGTKLLELQSQVTSIVRADFPNLDFVQAVSKKADKEREQLNRKTLREELFSSSFNYCLYSDVYDVIKDRKRSVCRINWPGSSGTGFLLSKRKILTCFHVFKDLHAATLRFTDLSLFTATFFVSSTQEYKVSFPATTLKCHSEDLDYAILQLSVDDDIASVIDSLPYLGRYISESVDDRNMVVVVGHPYGGSKIVDFCPIAGLDQSYIIHVRFGNPEFPQEDPRKPLYHTGVMFHGSSGSPGFDTHGNVVLMHTRGFFPDRSRQSLVERGVRLSAIREHARNDPNLAPEVFSEIFP
ncbi:serine protease FAM111A-like [Branchiostoma lanceolatum]|uniref:serine protease FAM111A-like n=1 Tax=Branchiostoma lanceolatum TaxID=7740 RepID=UPI003455DED1